MSESLHQRLSLTLQNEQATNELIDLSLEFFFNQPIDTWLDLEILFESIQSVYRPQVMKSLLVEWLPRLLDRSKNLDHLGQQNLSTWLSPELDAELRSLCAGNLLLSPQRIQSAVQHPLTHHITQAFVQETLQRFIQRVKPNGEGGGLLGAASRGALGWASKASRGALSGLGEQLQTHLNSLTKEFIAVSMNVLLEQLGHILSSPEVAQQLAEAQLKWYDQMRSTSLSDHIKPLVSEANDYASAPLIETWSELISDWISHVLEHVDLAAFIGQAHQDLLSELGQKTPREVINDEHTLNSIKDSIKTSIRPLVISGAQSESFTAWCLKYLIT